MDQIWVSSIIPQLILKINNAITNNLNYIKLIGSGHETRAFCYVLDVVNGLKILMEKGIDREIYHIGNSDEEIKILDLAQLLVDNFGKKILIKSGENLHLGGTNRRCPDINKISKLGYKPMYNLNTGLNETFNWYINNLDNLKNKRPIDCLKIKKYIYLVIMEWLVLLLAYIKRKWL